MNFQNKDFTLNEHVENFFTLNQNINIQELLNFHKKDIPQTFFQLFQNKSEIDTQNIWSELDINNVLHQFNKTKTNFGDFFLKKLLNSPSHHLNILQERQQILKTLNPSPEISNQIKSCQKDLNNIFWFFKEQDEHSDFIYNLIFYNNRFLKFLNTNESFMHISNCYKIIISPVFSALSPLIYILVPFVLIRIMGLRIPFKFLIKMLWNQSSMISLPFVKNQTLNKLIQIFSKFLSVFFYFQSIYNNYLSSKSKTEIIGMFQEKLSSIKRILNLNHLIEKTYPQYFPQSNVFCHQLLHQINQETLYDQQPKLFNNKGRIITQFYQFIHSKECILDALINIGLIDCYYGIIENNLTLPTFLEQEKPFLKISKTWHPNVKNPVKNSIVFKEDRRNYLLTGPNAAGKSTFIKSIFLNIYLAQTIGVVHCHEMEITPFEFLVTSIRNQDEQGKESLFEAEVHKVGAYLDKISKIKGKVFSIIDEVFTSTNYQEGFAASMALCETIGKHQNCLHIVTTHYTKLYKIEKKKETGFKNIKFSVLIDGDKISFPYKLERGYSRQFIALKLMRQKKLNDEFLNKAIKLIV